jgi:hypothetical protein
MTLVGHVQQAVVDTSLQDNIRESLKRYEVAGGPDCGKSEEVVQSTTHAGELTFIPLQQGP